MKKKNPGRTKPANEDYQKAAFKFVGIFAKVIFSQLVGKKQWTAQL